MSFDQVCIQGTLKPDGTLELDEKPALSPGRVQVILRVEAVPDLPADDPFWQRMQAIWNSQKTTGRAPRTAEEIDADRRQTRDEWEKHQQAIERLQEERQRSHEGPNG
jgi:hypothetical protein